VYFPRAQAEVHVRQRSNATEVFAYIHSLKDEGLQSGIS
jgi:hypothetical protein